MFKYSHIIKFHEVDAAGIIFFANVYKIAHDAYQNFLFSLDLDENYFESKHYAIPLVHSSADYLKPIKFNDTVTIEVKVVKLGESSFELNYNFLNEKNEITVQVETVHVMIEKENFKKTNIPEKLKKNLAKFL